jgi:putative DNA methylase
MGQMLYAVALKRPGGFDFRVPTPEDLEAARAANAALARLRPRWEAENLIPTEPIPEGERPPSPSLRHADLGRHVSPPASCWRWGRSWRRCGTCAPNCAPPWTPTAPPRWRRIWRLRWTRRPFTTIGPVGLIRHGGFVAFLTGTILPFVWSHGEFDASANLLPWCIDQVADAYQDMARLLAPAPPASALAPAPTPAQDGPRDPPPGGRHPPGQRG